MTTITSTTIGRVGYYLATGAAIATVSVGLAVSTSTAAHADPVDPAVPVVADDPAAAPPDQPAAPFVVAAPPVDQAAPPADDAEQQRLHREDDEDDVHNILWGPYGILNPNNPSNPNSPNNPNNWTYH